MSDMTYSLTCSEAGFNCAHVIKGSTKEEIMQQAGQHAMKVHDLKETDLTPELVGKIQSLIKET